MRTRVYIDGFSLYYGFFKGEKGVGREHLKWLDLRKLAESLVPDATITSVFYFTARVGDTPTDRSRASRQDTYIRALRLHARIKVIEGRFQTAKREGVLVKPGDNEHSTRMVLIRQEKGSDVALASRLLLDSFRGNFDQAVVITNDSDYCEPFRIVREELGQRILLYSPDVTVSKRLAAVSDFARPLDVKLLGSCQLPDSIHLDNGHILTRPTAWTLPCDGEV